MGNDKIKNDDLALQVIQFAKQITPLPIETVYKDSNKYSRWGEDNLYPNFLLELYNKSATHKGILTSKVDFIMGDGLVDEDGNDVGKIKVNAVDTLEEFVQRIVNDYVIFNRFSSEIVYNVLNRPMSVHHIAINRVRPNRDLSKFWVSDDWKTNTRNLLSYDRYIVGSNEDGKNKLFSYSNYTPSVNNVYPDVDYSGAIYSIVTDNLINEFFQNNIQNGFSAGHILSTFKGVPDAENMRIGSKKLQETFSGANGTKLLIDYNSPDASARKMEIQAIEQADYASSLIEVIKKTKDDILTAHQATSPLLFGVKTEGQLGGTSELEVAYQLFKDGYVKNRRNELESGLNKLFSEFPNVPRFAFKDKVKLFAPVLSDATKEKVMTINEIRAEVGLPALANSDIIIGSNIQNAPSQFASNKNPDMVLHELSEEDFEKIADKGLPTDEFTILNEYGAENFSDERQLELQFDDDADVANYLTKRDLNGKTIEKVKAEIKKELGIAITKEDLVKTLNKLTEANVISTSIVDSIIQSEPVKQPKNDQERKVEVMYSYEKRPDVSGDKIISTSRAFCKKIGMAKKLYSREDIQSMSAIFGYDVFKYCGGFYTSKTTGETTNYCRHYFKPVQVIRKGEGKK